MQPLYIEFVFIHKIIVAVLSSVLLFFRPEKKKKCFTLGIQLYCPANAVALQAKARKLRNLPSASLYSGEGNGTPLQYSCLENPMDRRAWQAAVQGVAKSRTQLKRLSSSSSSTLYFKHPPETLHFAQSFKLLLQESLVLVSAFTALSRTPRSLFAKNQRGNSNKNYHISFLFFYSGII